MIYLLDTDVIINHLRLREAITPNTLPESSAISVITYGELLYGAYKSSRTDTVLDRLGSFLTTYSLPMLNLDTAVISVFSRIKASLDRKGERLDDIDLLIAATAIHHSLILVTKKIKHFSRIPDLVLYTS